MNRELVGVGPPEKESGAAQTAPSRTETRSHIVARRCGCQAEVLAFGETTVVREESATITPPSDQIDYVSPLKRTVRHSNHELKQAWRDETHAVYKHLGCHGQFIGWESIRIKVKSETKIFGKVYPEREVYPGNEDFGRCALSVGAQYDLEYAVAKAKTLKVKTPSTNFAGRTGKPSWTGFGDSLELGNKHKHKHKLKHRRQTE